MPHHCLSSISWFFSCSSSSPRSGSRGRCRGVRSLLSNPARAPEADAGQVARAAGLGHDATGS
eukprot:3003917-Pyramimonas_sp.AAC.1